MSDKNDQYHVVYTDAETAEHIELYCIVYDIHKSVLIRGIISDWLDHRISKEGLIKMMVSHIEREWETYQLQQAVGKQEPRSRSEFLRAMELKYRGKLKNSINEIMKILIHEKD